MLLGALDTYVVVTIMSDIMRDVGIGINQIQRVTPIITGYLLGYIAAMPLLGRASDRFGRKLLLQVSLAGFAVGSVVTAMSTDLDMLVIGRLDPGHRQRRAAAGDPGAGRRPVGEPQPGRGARRHRRRAGTGQRARPAVRHRAGVRCSTTGSPCSGSTCRWPCIAMVMIHFSLPSQAKAEHPEKVDVVGGVLLAIALGLARSASTTRRRTASRCCPAAACPC